MGDECQYHFSDSDGLPPLCYEVQQLSQAVSLKEGVRNPDVWGDTPFDYVKWFDKIWRTGDPAQWGPDVFTENAIMIDSAGTSVGANQAASDFLLLFKYFPALRGEVVSWGYNHTEIMINWRFVVARNRLVPVVDKFSFVGGRVSLRQAYFDTVTFLSYLAENHGAQPLVDYFVDRFWRAQGGAGVLFLPGLLWALFKGSFLWTPIPLDPPANVVAIAGDGQVELRWEPVEGARSYTVKRARVTGGPYAWIASNVTGTSYTDRAVKNDTEYFYVVSTNSEANAPPIPQPNARPQEA